LRFDINEADVQLILAADQFKEIGYVEYRGDSRLSFGETSNVRTMLVLFGAWNPKPPAALVQVRRLEGVQGVRSKRGGG
jgi:hypothetical protein